MSTGMKIGVGMLGVVGALFILSRLDVFAGKRPSNLGVTDGRLTPCPDSPNCVSTQAPSSDEAHQMASIPYEGSQDAAKEKLLAVIAAQPRTEIVENRPDYLYVVFRTPVLRFADDVEFYFDAATQQIHFRSASRLGYSDMGLNRRRMEKIQTALEARK